MSFKISGIPVGVDCDDTLVSWKFCRPDSVDAVAFEHPKLGTVYLNVNWEVVAHVKRHVLCGHQIVIWSAGGADWAETVAKHVGLDDIAVCYMEKFRWIVDDKPAAYFLPEHIRNSPEKIRGDK